MNHNSTGFLRYYLKMFAKPDETFSSLLTDGKKLNYGLLAAAIPAIAYTVFYILASHAGGAPSTVKPWLALPMEKYFYYGIFLAIPGYAISFFTASSVLYLILRYWNRDVSYDDALTVTGFGIGVASWSTMIHDLADSILGFFGVIDIRAYEKVLNSGGFWDLLYKTLMIVYTVWFVVLFAKGIRRISEKGWIASGLSGFFLFIVFQVILVIFIR